MRSNWRVARVQECKIKPSQTHTPVLQVRFSLLKSYKFEGHKVRKVFSTFSLKPEGLWKVQEFLNSIEVPELVEIPNRIILGRYCRLLLTKEEYESKIHLRIIRFAPLNPHIKTSAELESGCIAQETTEEYDDW
jgi:hypothetical protein